MEKFAMMATIKTVPGKREEYLKHLKAHAQRCLATEPGTLNNPVGIAPVPLLSAKAYDGRTRRGAWSTPCQPPKQKDRRIDRQSFR